MTAHRNFGMTSQRDIGRGRFDRPAGSRGVTQYYAGNSSGNRNDDRHDRDHQGKLRDPKGSERKFLRVVPIHPCVEIHPLPSGSITAPISPLEPIDLAKSRFNEARAFALLVNFIAWGLILIAGRWLLSVLF